MYALLCFCRSIFMYELIFAACPGEIKIGLPANHLSQNENLHIWMVFQPVVPTVEFYSGHFDRMIVDDMHVLHFQRSRSIGQLKVVQYLIYADL